MNKRKILSIAIIVIIIAALLFSFNQQLLSTENKGEKMNTEENKNIKKATFAGGCFWCIEDVFDNLDGVIEAVSGYTGGDTENPTYEEVSTGKTGHYEAVQITYDTTKISYKELLYEFWRNIDPTNSEGQFADRGSQYRTAIFYHDEEQKKLAEKSKEELDKSDVFKEPIVTGIIEFDKFYRAEDYHQDYYKKCPVRYKNYKIGSGREAFIENVWGEEEKK